MIPVVDDRLNHVTMYRLTLYALWAMAAVGVALDPSRLGSLVCLLASGIAANRAFARIVGAAENVESSAITSLILFLILFPAGTAVEYGFLAFASVVAMASKYLLAWNRRHVFNPAAFAALVVGAAGWGAGWWVGSAAMLPVVFLGGALVARKTRRISVSATFFAAALVGLYVSARWSGTNAGIGSLALEGLTSWPIVFFGTVMLTEPMTLPTARSWQHAEAALVGVLFAMPYAIGPFHSSPELALVIGNLFALADGIKRTHVLRFVEKRELAPGVFDYAFTPDAPVAFRPGQYLEWTLPHAKPDARGNRRTFTVASSPGERLVRLGIRMPERPSSFKAALAAMREGDTIAASNLGGEFVLPADNSTKLAFVAGGIGITPFRSMAQHMVETGERRDVVLYYTCKTPNDFVYRDVFENAAPLGFRVVYLATDRDGYLTQERVKKDSPDASSRIWYLSGPNPMVESYRHLLRGAGIAAADIRTDYFPGY